MGRQLGKRNGVGNCRRGRVSGKGRTRMHNCAGRNRQQHRQASLTPAFEAIPPHEKYLS
ncbi:hypothetical protein [Polaromonas sp. CG9_12]|nr:hypothetical protein [Polaromonas sp. CG9_12]